MGPTALLDHRPARLGQGYPPPPGRAVRPTTVLVVDDQVTFADLLAGALTAAGMRCVGIAHDAATGVERAAFLRPDLVVMDVSLPDDDGVAATRRIRRACPGTVVAVLTAHQDPAWVLRATQAGASAFVPKNGSLTELLDVLGRIREGHMIVAPSTFGTSAQAAPAADVPALTRREREVLALLAGGLPVKGVARSLGITVETCRGYVKSLHAKLGVCSQVELVVRAQQLGLLTGPTGR